MLNQERIKEIEEENKKIFFESTRGLGTSQTEAIKKIEPALQKIGIHKKLSNIGISYNNKLVEILHQFEDAGLSMFFQKENGVYDAKLKESFLGGIIMDDLLDCVMSGVSNIEELDKIYGEISRKIIFKQQQKDNKHSFINKISSKIQENVLCSKEDKDLIQNVLYQYENKNEQIAGYSLKKDLVPSIIRKIDKKQYTKEEAVYLINRYAKPDLKALGLFDDVIEPLKEGLKEYYLQEVYQDVVEKLKAINNRYRGRGRT